MIIIIIFIVILITIAVVMVYGTEISKNLKEISDLKEKIAELEEKEGPIIIISGEEESETRIIVSPFGVFPPTVTIPETVWTFPTELGFILTPIEIRFGPTPDILYLLAIDLPAHILGEVFTFRWRDTAWNQFANGSFTQKLAVSRYPGDDSGVSTTPMIITMTDYAPTSLGLFTFWTSWVKGTLGFAGGGFGSASRFIFPSGTEEAWPSDTSDVELGAWRNFTFFLEAGTRLAGGQTQATIGWVNYKLSSSSRLWHMIDLGITDAVDYSIVLKDLELDNNPSMLIMRSTGVLHTTEFPKYLSEVHANTDIGGGVSQYDVDFLALEASTGTDYTLTGMSGTIIQMEADTRGDIFFVRTSNRIYLGQILKEISGSISMTEFGGDFDGKTPVHMDVSTSGHLAVLFADTSIDIFTFYIPLVGEN